MSFLPIVERELRVATRRPWTYRTRQGMAVTAFMVLLLIVVVFGGATRSGHDSFWSISTAAFLFCWTAGIWTTATILSTEIREGTLGFLFLTDLDGQDVVLGKLAGCGLRAASGLLAVIPVLAVSMAFGGVTFGELVRMTLLLVVFLGLSLSAGLAVSAFHDDDSRAVGSTTVWLVGQGVLVDGFLTVFPLPAWDGWLTLVSPVRTFLAAGDTTYAANPAGYWLRFVLLLIEAGAALSLASWRIRRAFRDHGATARLEEHGASRWSRFCRWVAVGGLPSLGGVGAGNPVFWLAGQHQIRRGRIWLWLGGASVLGWVVLWVGGVSRPFRFFLMMLLVDAALKVYTAHMAVHQLAGEKQNGALEMLLATPLPVEKILRGYTQAFRRQLMVPIIAALAAHVVAAGVAVGPPNDFHWAIFPLAYWLVLITDCRALVAVGLWCGIKEGRRRWKAFHRTLLLAQLVPATAGAVFAYAMAAIAGALGLSRHGLFVGAISWCVVLLVLDQLLTWDYENKLTRDLRILAIPEDAHRAEEDLAEDYSGVF